MHKCVADKHWIDYARHDRVWGIGCPLCIGATREELSHEEYLLNRYPYLKDELDRLRAIEVPLAFELGVDE